MIYICALGILIFAPLSLQQSGGCDIRNRFTSCPTSHCCVLDEFFRSIVYCKKIGQRGDSCSTVVTDSDCPCAKGLYCKSNIYSAHFTSIYGTCQPDPRISTIQTPTKSTMQKITTPMVTNPTLQKITTPIATNPTSQKITKDLTSKMTTEPMTSMSTSEMTSMMTDHVTQDSTLASETGDMPRSTLPAILHSNRKTTGQAQTI